MNYRFTFICFIMIFTPSLVFATKTHIVKKNESLYSLAKKYHVHVNDLKAVNNLANSHIKYGDTLVIPHHSSVARADVTDRKETLQAESYKVKKGDTLVRIAKKTGVSVKDLKRLNSLAKNKVKPGVVLALRRTSVIEEPRQQAAKQVEIRNSDLFSEKDYEQSLADLTDSNSDQQMDLGKNLDMKTDNDQMLKSKAYGFLGKRYRFGGSSSRGIDCSSFVQQVFREMNVSLPRTAREQFELGNEVAPGDLQKGDLVFFRTYAHYPSHVGIYLGNNKMIHASSHERQVVISSLNSSYYRSRFIGAKRIDKINPETFKFEDLVAGVEEESADDTSHKDSFDIGHEEHISGL